MILHRLVTIVETDEFARRAVAFLTPTEVDELKDFLARYPDAGDVIPGTGGARKLRWAAKGKGTRGGARAIYYYRNPEWPLFLFSIFAKSQQSDLSEQDKRALKSIISDMKRASR